jgi:hypothetical protein
MFMTSQKVEFQIDQLRKDKIIYATESVAVSAVSLVVILGASLLLNDNLTFWVQVSSMVMAVGYAVYMGVGNLRRLAKIKHLENELD